jgi:hypothetical protein
VSRNPERNPTWPKQIEMNIKDILSLSISCVALGISSLTLLERDQLSVGLADFSSPTLVIPTKIDVRPPNETSDLILLSLGGEQSMTFTNGGNRAIWIRSILAIVVVVPPTSELLTKCPEARSSVIFGYAGFQPFLVEPGKISSQKLSVKNHGDEYVEGRKDDTGKTRTYVCLEIEAIAPDNKKYNVSHVMFYSDDNIRGNPRRPKPSNDFGSASYSRVSSEFLKGKFVHIINRVGIFGHDIWTE